MRRLPVYILINTSSSISDGTLQDFKSCINLLIETLKEDPKILETAYTSIITYDSTITRLSSLSPLQSFKIPTIKIGKHTASFNHALLQLSAIIDNELIKNTYEQKGDWKPIIFILTDKDNIIKITKEVEELVCDKCGRIIICIETESVNLDKYRKITDVILPIESLDKHIIKSQIYWISKSIDTCERVNPYNCDIELPPTSNYIDIDSYCSEQIFTYEPICSFTTSSDEVVKEQNIKIEKTITCLATRQNKQLKSKKINGVSAVGGFLSSIVEGLAGIVGFLAGFASTSSNENSMRLECDKELEAKMAHAQMCKKQIEEFKQQKSNLEKELAVLEAQNKYNEVYSSIFAPAEVKRKSHLQVQMYLHLYDESEKVKSLARESDKNAERRDYLPLSLKLRNGDKVDVEFNVYGETRLMSQRKSIIWHGSLQNVHLITLCPKILI